jgi:hypothetical protein
MSDNDPIQIGREWHFSDGTILPVVSGGADDSEGDLFGGDDGGNGDDSGLFYFGNPNATPQDLSSPFLKNVAEANRPIIAKYLKDIQGGVTKRFQSIHDQYAPFKGLDPEETQLAMQFFSLANEDPEKVIEALLQAVPDLQPKYRGGSPVPPVGNEDGFNNPWADDGVPDAFAKEHLQLREIVGALAEQFMGSQTASQEAAEDAELDSVLNDLHENFGDFNEELVLLKIANGMEPASAVQAWQGEMQQFIDNRRSPRIPPPVSGGNGSIASGGVDPSKLGDAERKAYIAKTLEALQQNS